MEKYKIITKAQDVFVILLLVALLWCVIDIVVR